MNRKSIVRVPCSEGFDGYLPGMVDAEPRVACQAEPYRTKVLLNVHMRMVKMHPLYADL